jgi:hypothetical protein
MGTMIDIVNGDGFIAYNSLDDVNINESLLNDSIVYSYNGTWQSYIPGREDKSLTKLIPGYGYWVRKT